MEKSIFLKEMRARARNKKPIKWKVLSSDNFKYPKCEQADICNSTEDLLELVKIWKLSEEAKKVN